MSIARELYLEGIQSHELNLECLQRAIKRVDAAIQTDECALVNLSRKLHETETRLDWMRTRQIARQKELARQLTYTLKNSPDTNSTD